jgi:hypothetical protein
MTAVTTVDPIELVEEAITAGMTVEALKRVRTDLDELERDVTAAVLEGLVAEDDRQEREAVFEYLVLFKQLLLRAHDRLQQHVLDMALEQQRR